MRLSGNTRLRLSYFLGADSKSAKDGKCLQEPPHGATSWEGLPGGPSGASLCLSSPAPRTMPEIAADASALCPGLLWLFVPADGSPEPVLGTWISFCHPSPKDRLFHTVTSQITQDGVCGSKPTKSGVPEVPEPSLQWPQHRAALRQVCLTPRTKPATPHGTGSGERACRIASPPSHSSAPTWSL